ncbi:MAG: hypothetical protein GWN00_28715, partial [Aliifodinibius sp.]|nr:hypothetical protein [Fodinibius sp.]NIV14745.1 hypothetical protein [Fodinibius sp.]NIY28640.1 hypothetical protein [Fodinibius sp.]
MKPAILTTLILTLFFSCSKDENPVKPGDGPPPLSYTTTLTGRVLLENQSEHSNTLIYIDSLDIGARSDSGGYFTIHFDDSAEHKSGEFTVYYFVED